jgi:hypothetical protein
MVATPLVVLLPYFPNLRISEATAMDQATALSQLIALTAGLVPTAQTTTADLQTVREALANSLLHHDVNPGTVPPGLPVAASRSPSPAELAELSAILAQAGAAQADTAQAGTAQAGTAQAGTAPLVFSRSLPALTPGNPALTPAPVAGMQPVSIGPFAGELGALQWFDIFTAAAPQTSITRSPGTAPFLILPLTVPAAPIPATLQVGAGTLWIEAQLLAAAAPAGGYAGVAITQGTITFGTAATAVSGGLQVDAATTLTLTITPSTQQTPVSGGAPGADGGAVVADLPAEVTFAFTPASAQITAAGNASLKIYGTTVDLEWQEAAPAYDTAHGQLVIPFEPASTTFAVTSALSSLFKPAGTSPIQAGAWVLPVAVTAPAQLGTAVNAGMLRLQLGPGLSGTWQGLNGGPASLGSIFLSGAAGLLTLSGTVSSTSQLSTQVSLWTNAPPATAPPPASPSSTTRSSADLTFANGAALYYISVANSGSESHIEALTCAASVAAHIDRPVAADGSRLSPVMPGGLLLYLTASASSVLIGGQASATIPPIAMALHNALLVTTPPQTLLVSGSFTATPTELDSGGLELAFALDMLLPTLPDPYAANFLPQVSVADPTATAPPAAAATLQASVVWTPAATTLSFSDSSATSASLQTELLAGQAPAGDQQRDVMERVFNDAVGSAAPAYFLLDVSSNVDQLGVGIGIEPATADAAAEIGITGLDLVAPVQDLRVFTVPAIQWEPVITVGNPDATLYAFPSPAGFLDDGGPTLLGVNDVTLIPVTPAQTLDQVLSAYDSGKAAAVLFTLPFGMMATATLPARSPTDPIIFRRPGLAEVQPGFASQDMTGGLQVSLTQAPAVLEPLGATTGTPGLPGATVQLRNLVGQNGNPLVFPQPPATGGQPVSVLGPRVDGIFNGEFGPGAKNELVPVTRIDFSGYGASTFSAWTDPSAVVPAVVQVRFNVMAGRASHEVVQVKSILHPWGAIVVRTITIDRQDDGAINRHDSGWVAATSGTFGTPGITVHPGAVKGAFNIREIRDTTQVYQGAGEVELTGVYFDADIQIDGVQIGASGDLVPSTGQFGFVQIAPVGASLTPEDLAALITSQGALGGPVDCTIALDGTAQTMRVSRVEVANAPHPGAAETNEFAAAARGSVVLPQPGSWSVQQRADSVSEPTPIDPDLGVPLIQQGAAGGPATTSPWRLAEPADLWTPDAPSMDYCLLHATDSTRMLFPRPQLAIGAAAFTSDQVPLLADGFALMGATGICPRQDACLAFPDANYQLQISGAGAFTLAGVPASFAPTQPARTLAAGSAGTIAFEYANPSGTPAQIAVAITPASWLVEVKGANVRLDMIPFDGLMRTAGDFQASSSSGVAFQNTKLVLGSVLQPLEDLLQFLAELGLPDPLSTSFSNGGWSQTRKYKLKAGLQLKLPDQIPALIPLFNTSLGTLKITLKTGFGNTVSSSGALLSASSQWLYYFNFTGTLQIAVLPPLPVQAGGIAAFALELDFPAGSTPQSEKLTFELGVVVTVGNKDFIPGVLGLQAQVAFVVKLIVGITSGGPTSVTIGVGLILSASGQILGGLIGITFTAEADGLITLTTPRTIQATFDIAVDVSLCWCVDVSFDVSTQYTHALP